MIDVVRETLEWVAIALDLVAVFVVVVGLVVAVTRSGLVPALIAAEAAGPGAVFKQKLLGVILLGVNLLVASDVILTAAVPATLENMASLGLLVLIRMVLSWSMIVEVEERWPWQPRRTDPTGVGPGGPSST